MSPRYVGHIPMPNLTDLARDERMGHLIYKLVELGRRPRLSGVSRTDLADRVTTELYGEDFFERI